MSEAIQFKPMLHQGYVYIIYNIVYILFSNSTFNLIVIVFLIIFLGYISKSGIAESVRDCLCPDIFYISPNCLLGRGKEKEILMPSAMCMFLQSPVQVIFYSFYLFLIIYIGVKW